MDWKLVNFVGTGVDYNAQQRSLDPVAAEIVGARFMKLCGIGAPAEFRVAGIEAAIAGPDWVSKTMTRDGRLKHGVGWKNVLVRRIPGAISISALSALYGVTSQWPSWEMDGTGLTEHSASLLKRFLWHISSFMSLGNGKEQITTRSDFRLPLDLSALRAAIAWDSPQMLLLHAARLFLGCSAAHASNILVDAGGKLYSIDHELCEHTDCSEFRWLAENVRRGTRAWAAMQTVGAIEYSQLESLFDDLPAGITWPIGSLEKTKAYFGLRLCHWKANMELQSRAA
jgi:hypothetical protein